MPHRSADSERLTFVEQALLVAAWFRGGSAQDEVWISNSDQILTLSLFYSGSLTAKDCERRFQRRGYVAGLYTAAGELTLPIRRRYNVLLRLLHRRPDLITGGGNIFLPADPTYTSCRLTGTGETLAQSLIPRFPPKPALLLWPDRRPTPPVE